MFVPSLLFSPPPTPRGVGGDCTINKITYPNGIDYFIFLPTDGTATPDLISLFRISCRS